MILYDLVNDNILRILCKIVEDTHGRIEVWMPRRDSGSYKHIRSVSQNDFEKIVNLYYMYEFTDKLCVLLEDPIYPHMMNYVLQGIITEEELVEALMYKL